MTRRLLIPLCIALLATGALALAGEPTPLRLTQTIRLQGVEGRIDHMAYDAHAGLLYVAALGNNTVEVIDPKAGRVIHTLAGLGEPQGIAIAPAAKSVYVANAKDGVCRVFDAASYRPLGSIDLKDDADNVRYDAGARRIYVGHGDGALAVIDAATRAVLASIKLPAHPESFQLETKGNRIFVNLPDAEGTIAVVDRTTAKVLQTWRLDRARANFPMALDEPGHRLFVACRRPARLLVIDTETGRTVDATDCVGDADDVWYDAPARRVYVSGGEGFVSVFALAGDGRLQPPARVPTAPGARTSLLSPDAHTLFVAVPHRGDHPAEIRAFSTR